MKLSKALSTQRNNGTYFPVLHVDGYADELRFLGVPCCRECGDPGAVYYDYGSCGPVVWCEACAVDLLPLLEVE